MAVHKPAQGKHHDTLTGHEPVPAPAEVVLQFGRVCRPRSIKTRRAVVPAVARYGCVPPCESEVAEPSVEGAAEPSAGREEQLVIPVGRRQLQLELVLRCDIPNHVAIATDGAEGWADWTREPTQGGVGKPFETTGGDVDDTGRRDDRGAAVHLFEILGTQSSALVRFGSRCRRIIGLAGSDLERPHVRDQDDHRDQRPV